MDTHTFDITVIGGGPGGYVFAIRAAQLGMKVCVVEETHLGGICLNWGCIPTKALLRTAEIHHLLSHADSFGFEKQPIKFDIEKVVARSRSVAAKLAAGVKGLLKKHKVTVIEGRGKLLPSQGPQRRVVVSVGQKAIAEISCKTVVLATGARPRELAGLEPDGHLIWTSREAMVPKKMPKSLLIVGSGAIGIEFASFYHTMGATVTVVELQDRILLAEDEEIAGLARRIFEKQGIKIYTQSSVKEIKKHKNHVDVQIETNTGMVALTVDHIISAAGIVGNVENLGLEHTKVKILKGHIQTDAHCATAEAGVYAIGDVTGPPWLAHKASHEGIICAEHLAGLFPHPLKRENIPGCTYSLPQMASVGLTEKQALALGHTLKVGRFPYSANGKAIALGETEGLIKTIFDEKTGELLGAHMIGAEVTEMIQGYVIAKTLETTEAELMHTVFPHPTLSEMMHESVLAAYGRALHS